MMKDLVVYCLKVILYRHSPIAQPSFEPCTYLVLVYIVTATPTGWENELLWYDCELPVETDVPGRDRGLF
jgi:hypothetical protein